MYLLRLILFILAAIGSAGYAFMYYGFIRYWNKANKRIKRNAIKYSQLSKPFAKFSIVIPCRNERNNIMSLLEDLIAQAYPSSQFEIIVADDNSGDDTAQLVQAFIAIHRNVQLKFIDKNEVNSTGLKYKKAALTAGVSQSKFDWVLTIDADVRLNVNWLQAWHVATVEQSDKYCITGPVLLNPALNRRQQIEQIEFMGLNAMAASLIEMKKPFLANGANFAVRRDIFNNVNGYAGNENIASGDDEFLMQKINHQFPNRIGFAMVQSALVSTPTQANMAKLLGQRRRWVSKSTKYAGKANTILLSAIWVYHLFLLLLLIFSIGDTNFFNGFALLLILKWVVEWIFLKKVALFYGVEIGRFNFMLGSFFHIIYVVFIGILGNIGSYNWKERKLKIR